MVSVVVRDAITYNGARGVRKAHPAFVALSLFPLCTSRAHFAGAPERILVSMTEAT